MQTFFTEEQRTTFYMQNSFTRLDKRNKPIYQNDVKNITLHTKNVRRNCILICIKLKKIKKLWFKSFELKGIVINIYGQSINTIFSVDIGKQL